jgi:pimeloyl-ACP methyl ester carboxylesterase
VKKYPTILFLHGNGATRAFGYRVQHYKALSSRLSANVLAIDYRGFADSSGYPSEAGLTIDARSAFDWLMSQGAKSDDILIVGLSLGTGVGTFASFPIQQPTLKSRKSSCRQLDKRGDFLPRDRLARSVFKH